MTASSKLACVESELREQLHDLTGPLREVCGYALEGGRRVRASLLLEASIGCESSAVQAAAALELMHAATLLQDDIFDSGFIRRGRTSAHLHFGKPLAILASDWLLIRSLQIAAEVHPRFMAQLARAGITMVDAEASELQPLPMASIDEAQHWYSEIARGKTAVLFGVAMGVAALLNGAPEAEQARFEQLGLEMGLTYQIVDDCRDIYLRQAFADKSVGHDLISGCITLPLLLGIVQLQAQGVELALAELQAGLLCASDIEQLHVVMYSPALTAQIQQYLADRLTAHRREAGELGVNVAFAEWERDLDPKLAACFVDSEEATPPEHRRSEGVLTLVGHKPSLRVST